MVTPGSVSPVLLSVTLPDSVVLPAAYSLSANDSVEIYNIIPTNKINFVIVFYIFKEWSWLKYPDCLCLTHFDKPKRHCLGTKPNTIEIYFKQHYNKWYFLLSEYAY